MFLINIFKYLFITFFIIVKASLLNNNKEINIVINLENLHL